MDEDRMERMRQALLAMSEQGRRERAERIAALEATLALRSDAVITIMDDTLDVLEGVLRRRTGTREAGLDDCSRAIGVARGIVRQAHARVILDAKMK